MRTLLLLSLTFLMSACQPGVTTDDDAGTSLPVVDAGEVVDAGPTCGVGTHLSDGGCVTEVEWALGARGPEGRDHHATWVWPSSDGGAVLLVAGGIDKWQGDAFSNSYFARLDSTGFVQQWEAGPEMPVWQTGMALEVSGARAYFVGGMTQEFGAISPTPTVQSLSAKADGTPGDWREELPLPAATFYPTASRVGDWLFVIGGRNGSGAALKDVFRARIGEDGVLSDWVELTPLARGRTHHGAFVIGTRLFLVAGFEADSFAGNQLNHSTLISASVDLVTGQLSAWASVPLGFDASSFSVTVADGWVYVIGGFDGNLRLRDDVRRAKILADGTLGEFESLTALPFGRAHVRQTPIHAGVIYSFGGSLTTGTRDAVYAGRLW